MARERLSATFGRVLRERRLAAGFSQEELAHAAGVHRTYIGLLERGLRNPSIDVSHALAQALDTKLSSLVRQAERGV